MIHTSKLVFGTLRYDWMDGSCRMLTLERPFGAGLNNLAGVPVAFGLQTSCCAILRNQVKLFRMTEVFCVHFKDLGSMIYMEAMKSSKGSSSSSLNLYSKVDHVTGTRIYIGPATSGIRSRKVISRPNCVSNRVPILGLRRR